MSYHNSEKIYCVVSVNKHVLRIISKHFVIDLRIVALVAS